MEIAQQRKLQLETLYEIVDELNYYEILGLSRLAHQSEIEPAFRAKTQQFHPSALQGSGLEQDAELMDHWEYVLLSFKEARDKLIDPSDRIRTDIDIDAGQLRSSDTELTRGLERQSAQDPAHAANSDTSKKFWINGLQAFENGDYQTAVLQMYFGNGGGRRRFLCSPCLPVVVRLSSQPSQAAQPAALPTANVQ